MKKLRYIYALITVVLLSTVIYSCDDSSMFITEEVDTAESSSNGETVKTTFTVGISAPNVSGDLDVATRAGGDNANIEYANLENGGRFQNLIVVLTGDTTVSRSKKEKIYGVKCTSWNDNIGVKEHKEIFPDLTVSKSNVGKQKFYVYVFGNVGKDHYDKISGEAASKVNSLSYLGDWTNLKNYCRDASISFNDVYKIDFTPGLKYDIKYGTNTTSTVTSTGMPVNKKAEATLATGNTEFKVELKRVCARLQVTFRNFTGKTGYSGESASGNNVYVDNFEIKNVLSNKANYFCDNTTSVTGVTSSNFDILQALGGATATNDHKINKIENGKDLVVSMYVFENNKGGYQYDLKVDRGKSLGKNTTTIQPGNSYVIWNNQAHKSLAIKDNVVCTVDQNSMEDIPFSEQVFWQIESVSGAVPNTYILNNCKYDSNDKATLENKYLPKQDDPNNWGVNIKCKAHGDLGYLCGLSFCWLIGNLTVIVDDNDFQHKFTSTPSDRSSAQYVNFVLGENSDDNQSYFTLNLLKNSRQDYWAEVFGNYRYLFLTTGPNNALKCVRGQGFNKDQTLGEYDWTLYAKYIIRNGATFIDENIKQIERNHSYELDFSVMPNYETKQELLVSCVRKQNEVSWSEVQK